MQMDIRIYFSEDSELMEIDIADRGVRHDVLAEYNQRYFELEFITIERLSSEYYYSKQLPDPYIYTLDSVILVDYVSKENIIKTILQLGEKYFDSRQDIGTLSKYFKWHPDLQSIDNWVRVY